MNKDTGIYFEQKDYAGFLRRLAIIGIDLFVYWIVMTLLGKVFEAVRLDPFSSLRLSFFVMAFFSFFYSIEMKRRIGTLGNLLTKTKVVSIYGERPKLMPMIVRFAFAALGPIMLIIDLIWLTSEHSKQMIRDIYGGVYVVKSTSIPAGIGRIQYTHCFFLGYAWLFRKVVPDLEYKEI